MAQTKGIDGEDVPKRAQVIAGEDLNGNLQVLSINSDGSLKDRGVLSTLQSIDHKLGELLVYMKEFNGGEIK